MRSWIRNILVIGNNTLIALATIVIVASVVLLGVMVFDEQRAERYTAGVRPQLYYSGLDGKILHDYGAVLGIAHNSGDRLSTTRRALAYGADVIEIDVISMNGRLYAAHDVPLRALGPAAFRGPKLETVWELATARTIVKLDLKQSSDAYLELLLDFLADHRGEHQVIVATRDVRTLELFAEREPDAFLFLSVARNDDLDNLFQDQRLITLIDGVTILHTLLDAEVMGMLRDQSLMTIAWTVNDLARVNHLVHLGVNAITTDNLAILRMLSGQGQDQPPLARPGELVAIS